MQQPSENIVHLFDSARTAEFQQNLAEKAGNYLFATQDDAENATQTIADFIDDYLVNGRNQPIKPWLVNRFSQYEDIWESEQEKSETADVIISAIDSLVSHQVQLDEHLKKGKSYANFLNKNVVQIAEKLETNVETIYQALDQGIDNANSQFGELLTGEVLSFQSNQELKDNLEKANRFLEKSKLNAQFNLASYGLKMVGTRLKNAVLGKENLSRGEEILNILRSSIESAENKGIQIAISGGVVVSAKKGWIKGVFDGLEQIESLIGKSRAVLSRVQDIAFNIGDMWNDFSIADKLQQGVYSVIDAINAKSKYAIAQGAAYLEQKADKFLNEKGEKLGERLGAFIGSFLGPLGKTLGSQIGGALGRMYGEKVNNSVVKPMINKGKEFVEKVSDKVTDVAKGIVDGVKSFASKARDKVKSFFSW